MKGSGLAAYFALFCRDVDSNADPFLEIGM